MLLIIRKGSNFNCEHKKLGLVILKNGGNFWERLLKEQKNLFQMNSRDILFTL